MSEILSGTLLPALSGSITWGLQLEKLNNFGMSLHPANLRGLNYLP